MSVVIIEMGVILRSCLHGDCIGMRGFVDRAYFRLDVVPRGRITSPLSLWVRVSCLRERERERTCRGFIWDVRESDHVVLRDHVVAATGGRDRATTMLTRNVLNQF